MCTSLIISIEFQTLDRELQGIGKKRVLHRLEVTLQTKTDWQSSSWPITGLLLISESWNSIEKISFIH
jgi:hypothetical protein